MPTYLKSQTGQSLIEVLFSLSIVLLVIVALVRATTVSMKGSDFSKNQTLATKYAQEAIEWIRGERDRSWNEIWSRTDSTFCLNFDPPTSWPGPSSCGSDFDLKGGKFKREAILTTVTKGTITEIEVKVIVTWQDAGGDHDAQIVTYLSNWR